MRFAELTPWRRFTIETSWPVDVAVVEIQKRIDERTIFGGGRLPFVGRKLGAHEQKFSLQSPFNNPWRPIVTTAVVSGRRGGSLVHVRMRLHLFTAAFMTIWMSAASFIATMATVAAVRQGIAFPLIAWIFPFFGAALIGVSFAFGARKSERLLREIFERAPALPESPDTGEAYR